jgi:hypothetical protein
MPSTAQRTLRGALAGAVAAAVWAAQQPLDRRIFGVAYDDTEVLGRWLVQGRGWQPVGLALHLTNGALFGALYSGVAPSLPVPPALRGPLAGLVEHLGTWPATAALDRVHPAAGDLPPLWGSGRAFAQATWRHLLFGTVLGELERRLNASDEPPPPVGEELASSNGHGSVEHLVSSGPAAA